MSSKTLTNIIAGSAVLFGLCYLVHAAFAADLALPRKRVPIARPLAAPMRPVAPMPQSGVRAVPIAPATAGTPKGAELCLETGKEPFPGQTLQADTTCPTGMRWRFQR